MDKKKILLIGGGLLLGAYFLSRSQPDVIGGGVGGIGTVTDWIVTPDKPTTPPAAGGDVYTTYNITFPETAGITFPEPDFLGGGNGVTQLTETKKDAAAKDKPWDPSPERLAKAKMFLATPEQIATSKKELMARKEGQRWQQEGIKLPFGLPTLYPSKGIMRFGGF